MDLAEAGAVHLVLGRVAMLGVFLSILYPGLGQVYFGRNKRAILMMVLALTPVYPIVLIWSIYDAFKLSKIVDVPTGTKKKVIFLIFAIFIGLFAFGLTTRLLIDWYKRKQMVPRTRAEMVKIVHALDEYKDQKGIYPRKISVLVKGRPLRRDWLEDEWDCSYRYEIMNGQNGYNLISSGGDRIFGTDDDIKISSENSAGRMIEE